MQKLTMEQIRDIEEPADIEENNRIEIDWINDRDAEEYHISILSASQLGQLHNIYNEAAKALRAAPALTREQFFKKWGNV